MEVGNDIIYAVTLLCIFATINAEDLSCASRPIAGKSVVCVCNATYCDTITRVPPAGGSYVVYTSSQGGLRFHKFIGKMQPEIPPGSCCEPTFTLNPEVKYQSIEGFGSSVTDAAAIMWSSVPAALQKRLTDSYYSDQGLEYNMIRLPIGGSDFSTRPYAYNDYPPYDAKLTNFSLAMEDYQYRIPMIKSILRASRVPVHLVAATWSPPPWMKTNNDYIGYSRLLPEFYQTYADYHLKFLERYAAEGIQIWGLTTGNEPTNGMTDMFPINSLGWNADSMAQWIIHNLGPTIRQSCFKDIKIICGDDQRPNLPYIVTLMLKNHPKALDYVDGIGVHFYLDALAPPTILEKISEQFPDKFILATEASTGIINRFVGSVPPVDFGSWQRAMSYITDIINDLNVNVVGWIDWNMCLNEQGGPNWNGNNVDAPIIVLPEKEEFVKQPMFHAMGHFSKFVPRDSRRIEVTANEEAESILKVAFVTPRGTVVAVLYNEVPSTANIVLGGKQASLQLESNSITTIEFPYE